MNEYQQALIAHYSHVWFNNFSIKQWALGPMQKFNKDFCILEFPPYPERTMWTYATSGMAQLAQQNPIELHIFSSVQDEGLIELLTAAAYYHATEAKLDVGHTINFGKPWQETSICTYGLVSLPYLDGPELEYMSDIAKCYWVVPITKEERNFKIEFGQEQLEEKFDNIGIDYLNPRRESII